MAFLKEESNILFSFPSNPEPDENTDISFIPMHPVAQGHDDLNSTRCHHVIRVWMSYLEKKQTNMKMHVEPLQLERDQIGQTTSRGSLTHYCDWL